MSNIGFHTGARADEILHAPAHDLRCTDEVGEVHGTHHVTSSEAAGESLHVQARSNVTDRRYKRTRAITEWKQSSSVETRLKHLKPLGVCDVHMCFRWWYVDVRTQHVRRNKINDGDSTRLVCYVSQSSGERWRQATQYFANMFPSISLTIFRSLIAHPVVSGVLPAEVASNVFEFCVRQVVQVAPANMFFALFSSAVRTYGRRLHGPLT